MGHSWQIWKKPWERQDSFFELQEYGAGESERGWSTILQVNEPLSPSKCAEHFKPGKTYRLLAKSSENGQMLGVVWRRNEPLPGALQVPPPVRKPVEKVKPMTAGEAVSAYAKGLKAELEPLKDIFEVVADLRDSFLGGPQEQAPTQQQVYDPNAVQPLQYAGAAPWYLHPQVIHTLGEEIKGVTDHVTDRLSQKLFGEEEKPEKPQPQTSQQPPPETQESEEDDFSLPDINDYASSASSQPEPSEEEEGEATEAEEIAPSETAMPEKAVESPARAKRSKK